MRVIVVDYDPLWPRRFETLRARVWNVVGSFAVAVEHVGSTAVPGLAAKPIIDLSIVVAGKEDVALAIEQLRTIGYEHRGNLGIEGREAFSNPPDAPAHHLYLCPLGSPGLRNHLAVRDYLRSHPTAAAAYSELKKRPCTQFCNDIDAYVEGKTDFILSILVKSDLSTDELNNIAAANRKE